MSSLPQGGFQQRKEKGRRRVFIVGGILLALLIVWSYVVLSYNAGDDASGRSSPSEARAAPSEVESAGAAAGPGREAVPDDAAYVEENAGGGADGGAGGTDAPDPASGGTGAAQPEANAEPEWPEPEGYHPNPLGTGASAGDLAPIDQERVRFAAARFVTAAYGYSGHDKDAYNQAVGATVAWPVFYESPGAKEIQRYAAQVGETGTKSAALLSRFELTKSGGATASGYAHFETGEGYGRDGGLTGRKLSYRQKMTLVRSGGAWVVKYTDKIEET